MTTRDADLENLHKHKEVFIDGLSPFEAPPKKIEQGPLYVNIEERMPELGASDGSEMESPATVERRDFLKLFSASSLLATAACVRRPVEKALPYVNQPIDQFPGKAVHYSTTCNDCAAGCGLIVKTREGRPVKVEGNTRHPLSQGATCPTGQSTLQALYHPERRKNPVVKFGTNRTDETNWDDVYGRLATKIGTSQKVAILTRGQTGHQTEFFKKFLQTVGASDQNVFTFDPQTIRPEIDKAHKLAFGIGGLPRTELRRTQLIVGIGAEFLDQGVSFVYETKSWSVGHGFRPGSLGRLVQFESRFTQTGAKADERYIIEVGDELAVTLLLVKALLGRDNVKGSAAEQAEIRKVIDANAAALSEVQARLKLDDALFDNLATELLTTNAIVMTGQSASNGPDATLVQLAGIFANILIGAYGKTIFFDQGWLNTPALPGEITRFMENKDKIDVLFIIDSNPVFTLPKALEFEKVLANIPTVVSIQSMPNETDEYADFVLNGHHFLEAWGDEETVSGFWSIRQPVVRPITNSMQAEDILLWTAAKMGKPLGYKEYREFLYERWDAVFKLVAANTDYETFFKAVQRRGFVGKLGKRTVGVLGNVADLVKVQPQGQGLKLIAHLDNRLMDGRGADRPVLQEVGDSMTTVAWDTWVGLHPETVKELGLRMNDVVLLETQHGSVEGSVYPYPGLHRNSVVIPRGNGHKAGISKVTTGIGFDPLTLLGSEVDVLTGYPVTRGIPVKITATGKKYRLAAQQKANDLGNRSDIVKAITFKEADANIDKQKNLDEAPDLFPALPKTEYRWGMSIDLNKCVGCSACMVACSAENNVAQVGREQILRGREMHWIRLDRYFAGPIDNPEVTIQPMLCQHCNHAPCEAVCPVYATTHDPEGINSQTYNRCIGTRYCANACPYKVRRFNWFTHRWNEIDDNPINRNPRALNPDVTVRTRGIMEKCTFCIQRVRDTKHAVKERGGEHAIMFDGELKTACEQVCPADAIVFGNLNDEQGRAANMRKDNRAYLALGGAPEHGHYGLKTLPNVSYLAKVTHKKSAFEGIGGHTDEGATGVDDAGHSESPAHQEHGDGAGEHEHQH
ncbi:MAG: 4Fe-4S dicluster domain-containing protein [Oligoflexales bacterium]